MHGRRSRRLFFDFEIFAIVAKAHLEARIDLVLLFFSAQDKPLAAYIASNFDLDSRWFHRVPPARLGIAACAVSPSQYIRKRYNLTCFSRVIRRNGERALARLIFSAPRTHKYAISGTMSHIQFDLTVSMM